MTVGELLKQRPDIEIELLLAHTLKKPKEFLFAHPEHQLLGHQVNKLSGMIKRRQRGEPIAYILGYKDFCGLRFMVNRNVLIPRPETEELVEHTIRACRELLDSAPLRSKSIKILDLGTGSGCIAIGLAKVPQAKNCRLKTEISASDISPTALNVARKNARLNNVKIKFVLSDLFRRLSGKFDIIVANLPYVLAKDYNTLKNALRFEPKIALAGGTRSLGLYKEFLQQLPAHTEGNAKIFLEMDPKNRTDLARLCRRYFPSSMVGIKKDLAGHDRFLVLEL